MPFWKNFHSKTSDQCCCSPQSEIQNLSISLDTLSYFHNLLRNFDDQYLHFFYLKRWVLFQNEFQDLLSMMKYYHLYYRLSDFNCLPVDHLLPAFLKSKYCCSSNKELGFENLTMWNQHLYLSDILQATRYFFCMQNAWLYHPENLVVP